MSAGILDLHSATMPIFGRALNYPASMDKWVPYGQNSGIMPKKDRYGSDLGT